MEATQYNKWTDVVAQKSEACQVPKLDHSIFLLQNIFFPDRGLNQNVLIPER